jgi:hypothetical protein
MLKFDRYHLVTPLVPCQYDLLERKQNEGIDQSHDTSESFPGNMADHVQIGAIITMAFHFSSIYLCVRTPGNHK